MNSHVSPPRAPFTQRTCVREAAINHVSTPFGLARIDYGLPLTGRSGQPFGRWYFSLGQAF